MKIKVDEKEVLKLSDTQKKVIKNDIPSSLFQEDMERRIQWVLTHKYERCFERLFKKWFPILQERMSTIPTNKDEFAALVFSQPDYKDRQQRYEEEETNVL